MAQPQVVIVGGGPAGMATALGLAKNNVPCTVICQPTGNTYKPGETVPPNITTILHKLELKDIFNSDNHLHCYGNRFVWGNDEPVDKSFFTTPSSHGWHINRVLFEKELQQTAQQRDIPIIYATVTDCQWENNRWTLQYSDNEGTTLTLAAPFFGGCYGQGQQNGARYGHAAQPAGYAYRSLDGA